MIIDLFAYLDLVGADGSPSCAETDPEAFFPEKGHNDSIKPARRVCAGCEVRAACLAWALDTNQRHGIWGGFTERERRAMRRRAA